MLDIKLAFSRKLLHSTLNVAFWSLIAFMIKFFGDFKLMEIINFHIFIKLSLALASFRFLRNIKS